MCCRFLLGVVEVNFGPILLTRPRLFKKSMTNKMVVLFLSFDISPDFCIYNLREPNSFKVKG
jgi:hypothetical protein